MPTENENLQRVLEHLDKIHAKCDAINAGHEKLSARMDALEGEREKERADKARVDAEAKEKAENEAKEKADSVAENIAKIERAQFTEAQRAAFADAQMRADSGYQAWGKQAPHALHGETLRDFKIRLLRPLQQHSKRYAQSALELIGDEAAFQVVNDAIIADSVAASCDPAQLGSSLREITTRTPSGHIMTKFVGDAAVTWAPFMGGATKFGRIVRPKSN
jgi:hypothetical protein